MTLLACAAVLSGVCLLPPSTQTPRCPRAGRSVITITSQVSNADAAQQAAVEVVRRGGDTLKVTRNEKRGRGRSWIYVVEGYAFRCEKEE